MTTIPTDFQHWTSVLQQRIEAQLQAVMPSPELAPQRLHQAMRYVMLGGGKRVRPLLTFAAGEFSQADPDRVVIAACAVELIHAYSLVHDDLPCMDDDVLRRGKPACHMEFDEATALLVGDALQSLAFQLLAEYRVAEDAAIQIKMVRLLAAACGSRGMAGGQAIDLAAIGTHPTLAELEFMHIHKTGALIRAAVLLGAHCGTVLSDAQMEKLDHYAKCIGLAFQVIDDVLDAEATTATLGKTAGKDAVRDKPTYVSVIGIAEARKLANELRQAALTALNGYGESTLRLRELADFILDRKF